MRLNNSHVINELYQFNYKDISMHALDLDLTNFLDSLESWDDIFYYDNNLYILDFYVTGVNYKVNLETKEIVQLTYTFDSDVILNGYYQWFDSCGKYVLIIEAPDYNYDIYNVHILTLGEDIIDTPISIVSDKGYDIYDIHPDVLMTDVYNDDILYFSCMTDTEGKLNDIMYTLDVKKGTIESMNISIEEEAKDIPGTFEFAYISHGRLKVVFRIDKYLVFYEYSEALNRFNEIDRIIATYIGYGFTYFKNNHIILNYRLNEYIGILVYDLHTHEKYLTPRMANSIRDVWFISESIMADNNNDGHMYRLEKCDKVALDKKADKSELFSGDYNDLTNKPVVPNVDEFATKDEIPTFIDLGFYEDVDSSNNSNNNDGNNNNNINNTGNSNIDIEDVNFIHVTKGINLCNDDKAIVGAYSSDGSFSASTKYQYVEIKVKPGQIVKGIPGADINYKLFVLVDDNGNVLGVSNKEGEYVVTRTYTTIDGVGQHCYSLTVPEGVSMIYFQYQVSYAGLYNMLVIDNDMPSTYMPYEEKISLDEKIYVQNSKYADYANSITSPLKDKNIGFLGDSFTASDNAYHSFIAERTGCIRYNYGIGGTRITLDSTSGESFIHRVASMRDDLDIICVFGGINDASKYSLYETDHGTINDEILTDEEIQNGTEPLTFYSGVKTLISMLIAKYPEKSIVMIIPPHVLDATYEPALTAYNGIAKIVNALRECAEYYAIPTIDLYKNAQYLNNHPTNVALYRTAMNNIHPNTKAHIRMSYDIQKGLENIIW